MPHEEAKIKLSKEELANIEGRDNVLIIDDEETMQLTAKAIFEDLCDKTLLSKDGEEGVDLYKKITRILIL